MPSRAYAPRPYTVEEYRSTFLKAVKEIAGYWVNETRRVEPERISGFGFSFLNLLDGTSCGYPGSNLVPAQAALKDDNVARILKTYAMPRPLLPAAPWLAGAKEQAPTLDLPVWNQPTTSKELVKVVWDIAHACRGLSLPLPEAMNLAALLILKMLDGPTSTSGFFLLPAVHESDEEYHRDQGENWWAMPKGEDESAITLVWMEPIMHHEMYHSFDE